MKLNIIISIILFLILLFFIYNVESFWPPIVIQTTLDL